MTLSVTENPIFACRPEDAQRELRQRTALVRKSVKREMLDRLQSSNAIKDIQRLPGLEESLHIIARGSFPLWSIVPAMLELSKPASIDHLAIATLGFSKSNATGLLGLVDAGRIKSVAIVASLYFERQNPAEYRLMADGLAERGQRIGALRSHAKVIAMRFSDGAAYAIESSANLRSCRNLEQLALTNSTALYEFHRDWIDQVIREATR